MKSHSSLIPLDWFVCPMTKEKLKYSGETLKSTKFIYYRHPVYQYWDFAPKLIIESGKLEWQIWKKLQQNGLISYKADPEHNLGVGNRLDFIEFGNFCKFRGVVLDVGVGPQTFPTHMNYCTNDKVFFVGIDPLEGDQPKAFAYVKGLAEYLPFKSQLFDQVLFVTSIDHFIDPQISLLEARRVIKNNGEVCIWVGEKDIFTPKPEQTYDWYENLTIPEGAEDRFHYKRLNAGQLENLYKETGLKITRKKIIDVDRWRRNLFYCLTK